MNAIDLLKKQHAKVKKSLEEMTEADDIDPRTVRRVADELVAHMVIEEHVFYPRIRELMTDMVAESFEEHAVARFELARALMAEGEQQKTRLHVLMELVEHHVEEEEKEMFPKVEREVPAEELERLGARMSAMFDKAVELGLDALVGDGHEVKRVGDGRTASASTGARRTRRASNRPQAR